MPVWEGEKFELASTGSPRAGGAGRALSFDFLPDLTRVFRGHESSDSRTVGWGGEENVLTFLLRKASVTVGNLAELSKGNRES